MHPLFGEWYRKAGIDPEGKQLVARWEAIEAFTKELDAAKIAELVRCFVRLPWKNSSIQNEFVAAFQATDPAFPMRDNNIELQVLAGASIIAVVDQASEDSDAAASVLLAAAAPGLRKPPIVPEILTLAEKHIFDRSTAIRRVPERDHVVGVKHEKMIEAVKAACATNQTTQVGPPLESMLRTLNETINKVAQTAELAFASVERAVSVQAEESNIIWWIFGETSKDVRKRFSDLSRGFAAPLAGKELADLTTIIPGPIAARAYLDKVLGQSDTNRLTLADLVRETPLDWLSQLHFDETALDLYPVLHALHERARQRESKAAVRKQSKVSLGSMPLDVAMQMYRECIAARSQRKN